MFQSHCWILKTLILSIMIITNYCQQIDIFEEISNTKALINLYQKKLAKLQEIVSVKSLNPPESSIKPLVFLDCCPNMIMHRGNYTEATYFVGPKYIVSGNSIFTLDGELMYNFLGQVLCLEPYKVTSVLGNKISVFQFRNEKNEYLVDLRAQKGLKSFWHYSSEFENIFIQANKNTIDLIQSSGTRKVLLDSDLLNFYSVNQYKIFYLSCYSYGSINVRSHEVVQKYLLDKQVLSSTIADSSIIILLSNFTLLKVSHQKPSILFDIPQQGLPYINYPNIQISLIFPFLFLYSNQTQYFSICNISYSGKILFWKQTTTILTQLTSNYTFAYQFYTINNTVQLLQTIIPKNTSIPTKTINYDLQIPLTVNHLQFGLPWKIIIFVGTVIVAFYYNNKKQGKNSNTEKKQKNIEEIQDLLNKQMKKSKVKIN